MTALSLIFTAWSLVVFCLEPAAKLLVAIAVVMTLIVVILYFIDRVLIKIVEYKIIFCTELILGLIVFIYFVFFVLAPYKLD